MQSKLNTKGLEIIRGIDWVSPETREIILEIKLSNSVERTGRIYSEFQRQEMLRQMEDEKILAMADGRTADVRFFEQQTEKIKKKKLSKQTM